MFSSPIIPQVEKLEEQEGSFDIKGGFFLQADQLSRTQYILLNQYLLEADIPQIENKKQVIDLSTAGTARYDKNGFCDESYEIIVTPEHIRIAGKTKEGTARGVQTFRQLLYTSGNGPIPCVHISDSPRFRWRGMHLDVSRHFFSTEDVKRYIDHLALYRLNRLHLHLTDDQGWRVEIKKFPRLTEIGSIRQATLIGHYRKTPRRFDQTEYGGFYTQEEIKDLVCFAAEREIVIVPEVDMPGHMQAAIASYPELGCGYHTAEVSPIWGISQDILNVEESTVQFMQDVLEEIMTLFPGKFIHIGGDEAPKYQWKHSMRVQQRMAEVGAANEEELQSWFIRQMDDFITARGRRTIGWDEILEGGLAENAAVMSWRGIQGGIKAARMEHDVVMCPESHTYFDRYQALPKKAEPLAFGSFTPLSKVYSYEPIPPRLSADHTDRILGAQGQLWTEYIPNRDHLDYMTFPRLCAMAEVLWLSKDKKEYKGFLKRLRKHRELFRFLGITAHPRPK